MSAQQTCTVRVVVKSEQAKQVLPGAQVYALKAHASFISNEKGIAVCKIECSSDTLIVSYVGYKDLYIAAAISSDTTIFASLIVEEIAIQKVTVTQYKQDENLTKSIGEVQLKNTDLRNLPSLMGEPDVLRTLAASGGVLQIEGMQGVFVRGGSQDQNLILYDGATVYNPSHLLGFFSVFNSDIVSSASLFSSGAPAMYGGRLSSVLNIQSLPALSDSIEVSVNVGILSSRCMLNVPITSKSAVRVSLRKTYLNFFVMPMVEKTLQLNSEVTTEFGFYDATFRYDFKPNTKHNFYISAYSGADNFELNNSKTLLQNRVLWGNMAFAAQWKYFAKNSWLHSLTGSYSLYNFNFVAKQSLYTLGINTGITKSGLQYIAKKRFQNHTCMYGIHADYQTYNSGTIDIKIDDEPFNATPALLSQSTEQSFFFEDEWNITPYISCNASLRIVPYIHLGPATNYIYNNEGDITDTIYYAKNEVLYSNVGFEPRLQVQYRISTEFSFKASCMRTTQNMHMVSMLSAALPADIWLPASSFNPRIYGWISSLGFFKDFENHTYTSSLSVYYKTMQNIIEFKDGFITLYASSYNQKITHGNGFAFGTELSVKKTKGNLQGAISYNFSRSLRTFSELNQGYMYPASHDKPHDVNIQLQYTVSQSLRFNALWVYSSGKVYSEPVSKYFIGKNVISEYGAVNSSRMPAYHRLDVGAQYVIAKTSSYELVTQLSIFNVYNRKNTYYIYYETKGNTEEFSLQFIKNYVGLFPILPSLSVQMFF